MKMWVTKHHYKNMYFCKYVHLFFLILGQREWLQYYFQLAVVWLLQKLAKVVLYK